MKKLALIMGLLLITNNCYGGIIAYTTLSSDAGVSYSHFNQSFDDIFNEFNGSIDTFNLADGAVMSDDIATDTSPLVRDAENIGEYVYTGMLPATSANLISNISAGTAYVLNDGDSTLHRVVKGATSNTYSVNKDTWVYIEFTGSFVFDEQALGASQPTTPDNSIVLAKVVTNGTAITSVVDFRQLTPTNLRVYQDFIQGCIISRDADDIDKVNIGRGEIEFGSTTGKVRRNTMGTSINFATVGRGGIDTGVLAADEFYFLFGVADDDTETAFEGIASLSSSDATGVTGERLIGWCYASLSTTVSPDSVGAYRQRGGDAPNYVSFTAAEVKDTAASGAITPISPPVRFYSSGRPVILTYNVAVASSAGVGIPVHTSLSVDSTAWNISQSGTETDNYAQSGTGAGTSFMARLPEGFHNVVLKIEPIGQAVDTYTYSISVQEL